MEPLATTLGPLESTPYTRTRLLNETAWSSEQRTLHIYIYISLAICILGLAGNGLMIWFLIFCIKRKPFTIYILHLAIADFMVLFCSSVIHLVNISHIHNYTLENYVIFLMIFGYNTGLHLLTAISVERCLSVLYPIWYHCRRPKHQSAVACALLWALSVLVSGLENFYCILLPKPQFPECRYVYVFSCALTFLVFVPLMIFSNLILFMQVCCNLKPRQSAKLYVIIMVTVILFLLFAMPMKVLLIVHYYFNPQDVSTWSFLRYLNMLSTTNCCINPVVYFVVGSLRRKKSRKSLKETLQKVFEEKPVRGSRENVARFSQPPCPSAGAIPQKGA